MAKKKVAAKEVTGMYELLDALHAVVESAGAKNRALLAKTLDAFAEDFPDEFFWAVGPQSPTMLNSMMGVIDCASRKPTVKRTKTPEELERARAEREKLNVEAAAMLDASIERRARALIQSGKVLNG